MNKNWESPGLKDIKKWVVQCRNHVERI